MMCLWCVLIFMAIH